MPEVPKVAVLGAGAIGCFVGGLWQSAGLDVRFVGRAHVGDEIAGNGLTLSDHSGWSWHCDATDVDFAADPTRLAEAELIVLTVKCTALAEAARTIADHARPGTAVLSLLNGVRAASELVALLPDHPVIAGMVPFNVAALGDGRWHQGSKGRVTVQRTEITETLAKDLEGSRASLSLKSDMMPVMWGKLLLNLNNPVNALSGLTLREELSQRGYRKVFSASIREALAVLRAAGVTPASITALPPGALPHMLDTPDWFFRNVGLRLQKIDGTARSSMADDLAKRRPTEIDYLNGEVVALARRHAMEAPVNARVMELIKVAETEGLEPIRARDLADAVLG